jgi:hypothetical protein
VRCALTRDILDNALNYLEAYTQTFLAKHLPMSSNEVADFLNTFSTARSVSRSIFASQDYRSARMTLGVLLIDLID